MSLLLGGEDGQFPTASEVKILISNVLKYTGSDVVFWGSGCMKDKMEDTEIVRATAAKFWAKF